MEQNLTNLQIENYLERIGLTQAPQATRSFLDDLVYAHQCSVPFETIDMHRCSSPPALDVASVFQKIVIEKRGGYCFELNFLFELLLNDLGFTVRPCFCRAVRGRPGRMPINHRGIIVLLEGENLLVDVGFGGPLAAGSLLLADNATQIVRGETFITRILDDSWWAIDRLTQASGDLYGDTGPTRVQTELELCTASVENIDFESLNIAFSLPGTLFHDVRIANLRTPEGYRGLRESILTIREKGTSKKIELDTEEDFIEAVEQYFGFSPR